MDSSLPIFFLSGLFIEIRIYSAQCKFIHLPNIQLHEQKIFLL